MKEFETARELLAKLEESVQTINNLAQEAKKEFDEKLQWKKEIDEVILSRENIAEALDKCAVGTCEYRLAFDKERNNYKEDIIARINEQKIHFFMCYRGNHYARLNSELFNKKSVVQYHQEVIDKHGFCWWAKFFKSRDANGKYENLEPFGESIRPEDFNKVATQIRQQVEERVESGEPVYLYNYSPNPPGIELIVCNVREFYFGREEIPYQHRSDSETPQCAYFPSYYMSERKGNCSGCKKIDTQRCILNFPSNFWFKIDAIQELHDVNGEFLNLENCFTKDFINFAVPILYPLIVTQNEERRYFQYLGIFSRIELSPSAQQVLDQSNRDPRIIKVLQDLDEKKSPTTGANVQRFESVKDRDLWEYRFSQKGRIFVVFRKDQKPLVESIDFEHKHAG